MERDVEMGIYQELKIFCNDETGSFWAACFLYNIIGKYQWLL